MFYCPRFVMERKTWDKALGRGVSQESIVVEMGES